MKLISEVTSIQETKQIINYANVEMIVVAMDFLSLDGKVLDLVSIEKIIEFAHYKKIKVALNMKRIFHEDDFPYLNILFKNAIFRSFDYFIYSDFGIHQFLSEKGWSNRLIYDAPTYLTNTADIILCQKLNAYVITSNQITSSELMKILQNINLPIIVDTIGMACCFYSRRELIRNYLSFRGKKLPTYRGKLGSLIEETRTTPYHIVEDENGTRIFEEKHYYLATELEETKHIDYLYLHHFALNNHDYKKIVSLYNDFVAKVITSSELDREIKKFEGIFYKGAFMNRTVLLKEKLENEES